ncbi:MAG: M20/M25/M40 family metallo-hydrolase [Ignavibacteriales bacterium]|nr:M20/M25/M40 family metallo-hydrolase [Ignavibacteriales bacterium]
MHTYKLFPLLTFIFFQSTFLAQSDAVKKGLDVITPEAIKAQLEFLSSDWMEGRETGTKGNFMAGDYIASMFKVYGVNPAGDIERKFQSREERMKGKKAESYNSYFQNFNLLNYEPGDLQELALITNEKNSKKITNFVYKTDFYLNPASIGQQFEAPIVFVGYGYKNDKQGYNDFNGVNVKGKIILRLAGYPGYKDTSSKAYKLFKPEGRWAEWNLSKDKNKWAEELGAVGIIEVNPEKNISNDWVTNIPFRFNINNYEGDSELRAGLFRRMSIPGDTLRSGILTVYITNRLANEIIKNCGINFSEFEKSAQEKIKPNSLEIENKTISFKTTVKSNLVSTRNVLGTIEGENPDEVIVIGAHYDHVGMVKGYIWNGSDDNASGSVAVMTLAKAFAEAKIKPKKTIVFALWTGEEKGLLGSYYFVEHPIKPVQNTIACLNYDMISRDGVNDSLGVECSMTYTKAYPELKDMNEKFNKDLNLGLKIEFEAEEKPGGGSDHTPFAEKNIPIFYFMAGWHNDYHQPGDTADKADIKKMTNIIKLGFMDVWQIANSEGKLNPVK